MNLEDFMLPCPTKKIFGVDCFGCGAQRAIALVFEGRFAEAFHLFPAVYTTILFLVLAVITLVIRKKNLGISLVIVGIFYVVIMIFCFFY